MIRVWAYLGEDRMTFPQSERVVFGVNTLSEVTCQLQFPPILSIGAEAPTAFQERIRSAYPLYEREQAIGVPPEIAGLLQQVPNVQPPQDVLHRFYTEDRTRFITLASQFVALTEKSYTQWERMRPEVRQAQATLEETYSPAFYSRIGLRYQDVIDKELVGVSDQGWDALLNPDFAGLLGTEDISVRDGVREIASNALIELDSVQGGCVRLQHGLARSSDDPKLVYLIDADYFTATRHERGDLFATVDHFNREAGNLFRWAISPLLHDALGRSDMEHDSAA